MTHENNEQCTSNFQSSIVYIDSLTVVFSNKHMPSCRRSHSAHFRISLGFLFGEPSGLDSKEFFSKVPFDQTSSSFLSRSWFTA